eukprot:g1250.t1
MPWRTIANVDVDNVEKTVDVSCLQQLLESLAYGKVKAEDFSLVSESVLLKTFRLQQFEIEYLVNFQNEWFQYTSEIEEAYAKSLEEIDVLKKRLKRAAALAVSVKKEKENFARAIDTYREVLIKRGDLPADALISNTVGGAQVCTKCGKVFKSPFFLSQHIARRHPSSSAGTVSMSEYTNVQNSLQSETSKRSAAEARAKSAEKALALERMYRKELEERLTAVTAGREERERALADALEAVAVGERRAADRLARAMSESRDDLDATLEEAVQRATTAAYEEQLQRVQQEEQLERLNRVVEQKLMCRLFRRWSSYTQFWKAMVRQKSTSQLLLHFAVQRAFLKCRLIRWRLFVERSKNAENREVKTPGKDVVPSKEERFTPSINNVTPLPSSMRSKRQDIARTRRMAELEQDRDHAIEEARRASKRLGREVSPALMSLNRSINRTNDIASGRRVEDLSPMSSLGEAATLESRIDSELEKATENLPHVRSGSATRDIALEAAKVVEGKGYQQPLQDNESPTPLTPPPPSIDSSKSESKMLKVGDKCEGNFGNEGEWVYDDGTFDIRYDDGDFEERVPWCRIPQGLSESVKRLLDET